MRANYWEKYQTVWDQASADGGMRRSVFGLYGELSVIADSDQS
jgi:hypothetical protein